MQSSLPEEPTGRNIKAVDLVESAKIAKFDAKLLQALLNREIANMAVPHSTLPRIRINLPLFRELDHAHLRQASRRPARSASQRRLDVLD
jgi:hypothetical protein